jgi:hypothetical protein
VVTEDLINDSNYLAYKFNFDTECLSFLAINRDEIRQVSSLKQSEIDANRQFIDVPLAQVAAVLDSADQSLSDNPPRFIFHTAFCGSTFLSRSLDVDGVSVSLREPQILLDAANAKRLQWQSKSSNLNYRHLPKLFLALLQKHAKPSEKLIIKPINSVNNIIPELMQITGTGPALMLYTDARNFVLSTLKKGEGGKQTIRSMFDLLRCDFEHLSNLQLTHTIHMTDLRIIMTLWRLQLEQAEQALQQFSANSTLASLYGEELILNPRKSLRACNQFLDLGISSDQVDAIAASDDRLIDAKNRNERFGIQQRKIIYERLESFYGDDLNDGLEWLVKNNAGTQLIPELSGALGT